ncbi:hypothetical protein BHM03_00030192 [Ensete ventricosum]|uniref:Neprosin PEP catalytic domain-containing protein n=1 Tax=Ensete ventricosum TaxID=4639 RepID=A0A445MI69_ENSVE|nr:hypothetical protein BHM03_00030192 [Ensete ventricosum]
MTAHGSVGRSLVALLALMACLSCAAAARAGEVARQRLEVRRHLKRLNKTPVKSIKNGRCPEDTIPIRRTTREDMLRASSVKRYGRKKHRSLPYPLSVDPDLLNESGHQSDAYQATGCYNLLCSGFIQINNEIAMGASISPISDYDGSQYDISILVWKEGNWWMQFGSDYVLGYWPSFLFSYLEDSATMIEWGGEVVNSEPDGEHTSTEMGSGHFPEEGFSKASYFRNIQIVDGSNNLRAPEGVGAFTEQSNCYDVQNGNNNAWGQYFYYGGPGRNSNCP